jgi:hypothetical protein
LTGIPKRFNGEKTGGSGCLEKDSRFFYAAGPAGICHQDIKVSKCILNSGRQLIIEFE